jgi:hypothetical protein
MNYFFGRKERGGEKGDQNANEKKRKRGGMGG